MSLKWHQAQSLPFSAWGHTQCCCSQKFPGWDADPPVVSACSPWPGRAPLDHKTCLKGVEGKIPQQLGHSHSNPIPELLTKLFRFMALSGLIAPINSTVLCLFSKVGSRHLTVWYFFQKLWLCSPSLWAKRIVSKFKYRLPGISFVPLCKLPRLSELYTPYL